MPSCRPAEQAGVALVGVLLLSALFAPREKQVELLLDGHGQKPSPLPMAA